MRFGEIRSPGHNFGDGQQQPDGKAADSSHAIVLSLVEEIDIRLVENTDLLPGLSQLCRFSERLRAAKIRCLKQNNDFIRIVSVAKKMLLGEARLVELGKIRVVAALPFCEVPHLVSYEHKSRHGNPPLIVTSQVVLALDRTG